MMLLSYENVELHPVFSEIVDAHEYGPAPASDIEDPFSRLHELCRS